MNKTYAMAVSSLILCMTGRTVAAAEHANETDESIKVLVTQVCSVCHGAGGHSTFPGTPNLAAQTRQYLRAKIKMFGNRSLGKSEGHIDVLGLTLLDDPGTEALAHYFASQPPATPVVGDAALVATGNKIFATGVPEKGIAACAICHGVNAGGFWIFPRLAGQHAEYVERQLRDIQSRLRDSPVMHGVIKDMTPEDMKAVAAFVQSK